MNFAAFFSYITLTAFTPGPNNVMAMTNAGRGGFKRTIPFLLGVLTGFFAVMCCCAAFSAMLYELIPTVKPYMLCIGAAYMLRLAWSVFRNKPHEDKKHRWRTDTFFSGMLLQFINVKIILYGITALSSFVLPYYNGAFELLGFVLILTITGFAGTCCWALFGAVFERFFKKYGKIFNIVMAVLLLYCAVTMILDIF